MANFMSLILLTCIFLDCEEKQTDSKPQQTWRVHANWVYCATHLATVLRHVSLKGIYDLK